MSATRIAMNPNRSKCLSCQAPIVWALTAKQRPIPINAEPTNDGRYYLVTDGYGITAHHAGSLPMRTTFAHLKAGAPMHTAHFATCPHANAHRKPK